jgi:hypothetical protein
MMENYNKEPRDARNTDHAQFELTPIRPNNEVTNGRQLVMSKDIAVQTDKIKNKNIRVQTEETTFKFNTEATNNQRDRTNHDVERTIGSSHKTAGLYLDSNGQQILDQSQGSVVMEDIGNTSGNSITHNHRVLDVVAEELMPISTTIMNDIEADLGPVSGYADELLLPLIKACAPLIDIIPNLPFYIQLAMNETPEQPPDGLTIDESAAIRLYTIEWEGRQRSLYSMINRSLKKDTRENLRPYFKYMKLFLTALAKLPCLPPSTIWRGVTKDVSTQFPPGTPVIWWPFSSCTTELTVLENNMYLGTTGKRTLFSVEVINGRTIRAHSHFVTEDEILLLPGTQMIVQSQFSPAPDLHIIHLKQVIPDEVLLEPPFEGIAKLFNHLL